MKKSLARVKWRSEEVPSQGDVAIWGDEMKMTRRNEGGVRRDDLQQEEDELNEQEECRTSCDS